MAARRSTGRFDSSEDSSRVPCVRCGGKLKIIASIEEPELIAKILAHLAVDSGDQAR